MPITPNLGAVYWPVCLIAAFGLLPAVFAAEVDTPLTVTIHPDQVLAKAFMGFGAQWEYEGENPKNNTDDPAWSRNWPVIV